MHIPHVQNTACIWPMLYCKHSMRSSVAQAQQELGWNPEFSLVDGLRDSYEKDFGRGTYRKEADFTTDDLILAKHK